jgi:hypothetical protein
MLASQFNYEEKKVVASILIFMQEWRLLQLDEIAQHSDTHSCVIWNVDIQSNIIDNNKMQSYKLTCN